MYPILHRTMNLQMRPRDIQEVDHSATQGTHTHIHLHITPDMYMCIHPRTTMVEVQSWLLEEGLQLALLLE